MEEDEEHADEAAPDAHLDEFSGIGHDWWREQQRICHREHTFTKGDVFQDRLIRKPTEFLKQCSAHEQSLIPIDDPAAGASKIVQK